MEPGEFTANRTQCIISGNNIASSSRKDRVSSTTTTYTYRKSYIKTAPSATIFANTCQGGLSSTDTGAIEVSGAINFVTQNKIYRLNGNIRCYVGFTQDIFTSFPVNSSRGVVSHNYFDRLFVNNDHTMSNYTDLVIIDATGLDVLHQWIIEKNINQIYVQNVPMTSSQVYINSGGLAGVVTYGQSSTTASDTYWYLTNAPSINDGFRSETLWYHDDVSNPELSAPTRHFGWQENIDKYVPKGARVVSLTIGVRVIYGIPAANNAMRDLDIRVFINRYKKANKQDVSIDSIVIPTLSSPLYSIPVGVGENDTGILGDSEFNQTCISYNAINFSGRAGALFKKLDLTDFNGFDVSDYFVSGLSKSLSVSATCTFTRNISVIESVDILFTPVAVEYRW